jgi:hypothetical protein
MPYIFETISFYVISHRANIRTNTYFSQNDAQRDTICCANNHLTIYCTQIGIKPMRDIRAFVLRDHQRLSISAIVKARAGSIRIRNGSYLHVDDHRRIQGVAKYTRSIATPSEYNKAFASGRAKAQMPSRSQTPPRRFARGTARRVAFQGGGSSRAHYPGYDHQQDCSLPTITASLA